MKDIYILGIESSCDETSASIVKNGTEEIATVISSQIDIHKNYGGVVPEIASRHHVKNITIVLEECLEKANMTIDDVDAIAITYGPGLIGSLLIGLEAAKTLSFIYNKPLIPVHHIAGHIYANSLVKELRFPLLAVVVSGGHTEIIEMKKHYSFEKLGGTLDDAIGECYDKVARVANINNEIEKLKKQNIWVYACELGGDDLTSSNLTGGIAIVIGSEGRGTGKLTLKLCDGIVTIPQYGKINSLNASVATGIVLYEVSRQRKG